jgi:hypothetical protein
MVPNASTDDTELVYKRRIVNVRPVGGVGCSRCGENKNSGNRITIDEGTSTTHWIMCDSCTDTFRSWYNSRTDESGWVTARR